MTDKELLTARLNKPKAPLNAWLGQKLRPTQFSDAKNTPGKSYDKPTTEELQEIADAVVATGPGPISGPVPEDSVPGQLPVQELSPTE